MALAPEISGFGDGSHQQGEGSLTIDGGGFGAFPGRVLMAQNPDGSGLVDVLTVGAWNDIAISGVQIPGSSNNSPGTVYLIVEREDLATSQGFEFTLVAGVGVDATFDVTEGSDTIASSADVEVSMSLTVSEASDTASGSVDVTVTSELNATEASDTILVNAGSFTLVIMDAQEEADSISVDVTMESDSAMNVTEAADSIAASASVSIESSLAVTEESDTVFMTTLPLQEPTTVVHLEGMYGEESRQNFSVFSGNDVTLEVELVDTQTSPQSPLNLVGVQEMTFAIGTRGINARTHVAKTLEDGITVMDQVNGVIRISLNAEDLEAIDGAFIHELRMMNQPGNIATLMNGVVVVKPNLIGI